MGYVGASFDLETLSLRPNGVILSAGVAIFNDAEIIASGHFTFGVQHQIDMGRHIKANTLGWWMVQSEGAQNSVMPGLLLPDGRDVTTLNLGRIADALAEHKVQQVWGYGSVMDVQMLETLYDDMKLPVPWSYKNVMCLRTLAAQPLLANVPRVEFDGVEHNAEHDAIHQARRIIALRAKLMGCANNEAEQKPA